MDAARQLFEQYKTDGYELIQHALQEKGQESGILDYKMAENQSGPMTSKDREKLAEALSGFANSEGGILVWGIHARTGKDGIDAVQADKPVKNLKRFVSELGVCTPQVVSPGIEGVEHISIPEPNAEDTGYAVTYVPKGQSEPHMAVAKEQHCYYYRSGTSFLCMESFMVADRYRRRPQPKLELSVRLSWHVGTAQGCGSGFYVHLSIRNVGLGIALYPALSMQYPTPPEDAGYNYVGKGLSGQPGIDGLVQRIVVPETGLPMPLFFTGGINNVVHPSTKLDVTSLSFQTGHTSDYKDFVIHYELHCEGFSTQGEKIVRGEDISKCVNNL